ncbi:hypothetical protein LTR56_017691 [Elasticomyces elasticus]|nr:hypothetical protein LTR56_017691 [Elasticomyces elasticus]KAK3643792.1 hypothetical protein LTR22_015528 [Elasticomyces elasticus]KAK4912998.1 hypothetical protein LTR49_018645 [Elasticomyces elasticus]KAK5752405.1 hypothetical protein LTS12_017536 [Elasticomyces elasticus]
MTKTHRTFARPSHAKQLRHQRRSLRYGSTSYELPPANTFNISPQPNIIQMPLATLRPEHNSPNATRMSYATSKATMRDYNASQIVGQSFSGADRMRTNKSEGRSTGRMVSQGAPTTFKKLPTATQYIRTHDTEASESIAETTSKMHVFSKPGRSDGVLSKPQVAWAGLLKSA